MAARQGLFLLNDGRVPTFSRNDPNGTRQEALLDIAFSSKPAEIDSWRIRDDLESMSDNLYLDMTTKPAENRRRESPPRTTWNFNKMDKDVLRKTMDEECKKLIEEDRVPDEETVIHILSKACEEAQPKTPPHLKWKRYW